MSALAVRLDAVAAVADPRHPRSEGRRDAIWTQAGLDLLSPKAESGNGRDDEIVADLIGCRVAWRAKRINEVQKLNLRPRPSMKKEQRPAATGFCANVEKMDLYAVDRREKLRVRVQAGLDRAPSSEERRVGQECVRTGRYGR